MKLIDNPYCDDPNSPDYQDLDIYFNTAFREGSKRQLNSCEKELKEIVEGIFKEIETRFSDSITKGEMTATNAWQSLKKGEMK